MDKGVLLTRSSTSSRSDASKESLRTTPVVSALINATHKAMASNANSENRMRAGYIKLLV